MLSFPWTYPWLHSPADGESGGEESTATETGGGSSEEITDTGGGTPTPTPTPTPESTETPPAADNTATSPWWERRIDALTRQRHDAERRLAEAQAALAARAAPAGTETGTPTPTPTPGMVPESEVARLVNQQSAELRFNERCNDLARQGSAAIKDFSPTIENFKKIGGLPRTMIEAALDLDNGHEVLYALAKNLDETSRLLELSPAGQAAALGKMSAKLETKAGGETDAGAQSAVSRTPSPPSTGVRRRAPAQNTDPDLYDDKLESDAWFEARIKQRASQRSNRAA